MAKTTTRPSWKKDLNDSWIFEAGSGGSTLFYPHGWGRGYLVPSAGKRREIEAFLFLWQTRLRSAIRIARWCMLPLTAIVLATVAPPVYRIILQVGGPAIFESAVAVGILAALVISGSSLLLRFLAETAKADLDKADRRRPLAESARDYALRSTWSRLRSNAALGCLFLALGASQLLPQHLTVMDAASANPRFWTMGIPLIVLGGWMLLIALWLIRTKSASDKR